MHTCMHTYIHALFIRTNHNYPRPHLLHVCMYIHVCVIYPPSVHHDDHGCRTRSLLRFNVHVNYQCMHHHDFTSLLFSAYASSRWQQSRYVSRVQSGHFSRAQCRHFPGYNLGMFSLCRALISVPSFEAPEARFYKSYTHPTHSLLKCHYSIPKTYLHKKAPSCF